MASHAWVRFVGTAVSNISRDNISNTFCFFTLDVTPDWQNALDMIEDLYCTKASGVTNALGAYIAETINRTALLQVYRIEDTPPRAPVAERTITLPTAIPSGSSMPAEVALACSFQGTRVSGLPQARRRGRIFLGPLRVPGSGSFVSPPSGMISDVTKQFAEMKAASDASTDYQWRIWSPTDGASVLIDNGWVDNAWDTQRRRGPRATSRTRWP